MVPFFLLAGFLMLGMAGMHPGPPVPSPDDVKNKEELEDAQARLSMFRLLVFSGLFVIVVMITAEGLANSFSVFAFRFSRVFTFLNYIPLLGRLHVGHVFAGVIAVVLTRLLEHVVGIQIDPKYHERTRTGTETSAAFLTFWTAVLTIADSSFFYIGLMEVSGWGGTGFSFKALIVTVMYVSVLVGVSVITVQLQMDIYEKENEVNNE